MVGESRVGVLDALRSHWKLLLAVTVIAAIGIQAFEPHYNKLQTASDASSFRHVLAHTARATAATLCDVVFAAGYGALGLAGLRVLSSKTLLARVGAVIIVAAALFDELENLLLLTNIARHRTLTDGWIVAMRIPGTLKWVGSPVLLVVLVLLIRQAVRHKAAGHAASCLPVRTRRDALDAFPQHEVQEAVERYIEFRRAVDAGEASFADLGQFFTDDVVAVDFGWGRHEGSAVRQLWTEAMIGFEDWKFPVDLYAITGNHVFLKWRQVLPYQRPDGSPYEQSGYSLLVYAGDGRFRYQEDVVNMAHLGEDLMACGWSPPPGMVAPPNPVNRDFSIPST